MFGWIIAIVVGVTLYVVHRSSRKLVARSLRGRDPRLSDELSEYDGAHGADQVLGLEVEQGVARLYEQMCVLEPSKWAGDKRIPGIIKRYSDIVSGREADPQGYNVPSTRLLGRVNPDYEKYLKSQRKHTESTKEALAHARHGQREQDLRDGFHETLLSMGMPEALVEVAATDARIESYTQEQWQDVIAASKRTSEEYGEDVALDMLALFEGVEVLCSEEAAETYDALRKQGVPVDVSRDVVRGVLTIEQAERASDLVEGHMFGWQEAVKTVVSHDSKCDDDELLRTQYRAKVSKPYRKGVAC